MGLFSKKSDNGGSSNTGGNTGGGDGTSVPGSPTHRVEYTDANGFNSETAYSASSAEVKAQNAKDNGASNVSINPFKRNR